MTLRQPADERIHPHRVVMDDQPPVDMGGDVVPGRHHPTVFGLARVPGRRHVGVRPADDDQRRCFRRAGRRSPPLSVVPCDVPEQGAVFADRRVEDERQEGGDQSVRCRRHQVGGAVVLQQVSDVVVACSEVLGDVHGPPPRGQRSGSADRKCQDLSGLFQRQQTSSTVFPAAARLSIARNAAAPSARSYSTAGGGRSPFATSPSSRAAVPANNPGSARRISVSPNPTTLALRSSNRFAGALGIRPEAKPTVSSRPSDARQRRLRSKTSPPTGSTMTSAPPLARTAATQSSDPKTAPAPAAVATARRSGEPATAVTVAPSAVATCTNALPRPPPAPCTRTRSPARSPTLRVNAITAVK